MSRCVLRTITVLLALLLAGCTANASPPPSSASNAGKPTPTRPASSADTPTSGDTSAPSDPQLLVRQAWGRFWTVAVGMHNLPATQLPGALTAVAVDPALNQMKLELSLFAQTHFTNYGFVVNHVYETTLKSPSTAVIKDCMDQSHFGSVSTTTGKKRSVGVPRDNTTASLLKGSDNVWRVQNIVYLLDVKC